MYYEVIWSVWDDVIIEQKILLPCSFDFYNHYLLINRLITGFSLYSCFFLLLNWFLKFLKIFSFVFLFFLLLFINPILQTHIIHYIITITDCIFGNNCLFFLCLYYHVFVVKLSLEFPMKLLKQFGGKKKHCKLGNQQHEKIF